MIIQDIICNKCGGSLNGCDLYNGFQLSYIGKYGSVYDGNNIRVDLCNKCCDIFLNSLLISPVIKKKIIEREG